MLSLLKLIIRVLPWLVIVLLLSYLLAVEKFDFEIIEGSKETFVHSVLVRTEPLGMLEVSKYHFQEVTEVKKAADQIDLKVWKFRNLLVPDSRALLISKGSATGCVDLSQLNEKDLTLFRDTLYVRLPPPTLCNFKVDLEKSHFYDLQISGLSKRDQQTFIEDIYRAAEKDIKKAAIEMGILEQSRQNAVTLLQPILENIAKKPVIIQFRMDESLEMDDGLGNR